MSPVGWRGGHLSSGRCCLAAGRSAGHWLPLVGRRGGGTPGPRAARPPPCLAGSPSGACSAYGFTFLLLPGEPGRWRQKARFLVPLGKVGCKEEGPKITSV